MARAQAAYSDIHIGDFSGGLNVRDALTELAQNETPDCLNVVLDERGGAVKRQGYVRWNASATTNLLTYGAESDVCGVVLWYSKADGKLYADSDGTFANAKTFSAGGRISIADFAGVCYLIHSADGLWSSTDGVTWGAVAASSGSIPSGDQLAVWQNRLWVADSTSTLLWACAPGDATAWDTGANAKSNYIREGNDFPIVCIYGTSGTDVQAQPALLIGKRSGSQGSMHRVTDASTVDYVTLDQAIGPAGPGAITSLYGRLYIVSTAGLFSTDGQNALEPIGQKVNRFFDPNAIEISLASNFVAGRTTDRIRFSITSKGQTANDLCLEYHPLFGAFTARTDAAAWYVSHGQDDAILLGASPTVTGRVWRFDLGGADDGEEIESRILTRVFEVAGGWDARLQHVRILGRGNFLLEVLPNFADTGPQKQIAIQAEGFTWDLDGWDDPSVGWGADIVEGYDDFWPRLLGRAFQIKISEQSTDIDSAPPLNGTGPSLPVGAWAAYTLHLSLNTLAPIAA